MAFVDQTTGGRIVKEGIRPFRITLSGAVKAGDLVGYSSGWKAADMNSSPKVYPELVAGSEGANAAIITAYREAIIDFGTGCTATAGDRVYADTDAGEYVGVASNDQGMLVGVMLDAQTAMISPFYAFPNIKIPNTEYSNTSNQVIIQQLKSALAATGTASLTGIEIAPKVLDAVAAGTISGIKIAIDLEGASAGTVTTARGIELVLGSDSGTVRTVTNAWCAEFTNNFHGTITNGVYALRVNTHGGNVAWSGLAHMDDDGGNIADLASATSTINGVIKVKIGSTVGYIATYASYTAS